MNPTAAGACANCGAVLTGPYCAQCGQKLPNNDLTLREFIRETTAELTHLEGRVPTTLRTLFTQPGQLTRDFLAGRRARWIAPLKLYLICSVAYFASVPIMESLTGRSARELARITVSNPDGSTGVTPEVRRDIEGSPIARIIGPERVERAIGNPEINNAVAGGLPKAMFVLLPIFAFFTRVMWRRRLPQYPLHLYMALHIHAAWFGILAAMTVVIGLIPWIPVVLVLVAVLFAAMALYTLLALRRVFEDSWFATIVKSIVVAVAYYVCLMAAMLGILAYAVSRL